MERRVLLAIFLAFLVLYVWQAVFVKPVPKPAATSAQTSSSTRGANPAAASPPAAAPPPPAAPAAPSAAPLVTDTVERDVRVETHDVVAVFTNRGARLKSWRLKRYLDPQGQPQELVENHIEPLPFTLRTGNATVDARINSGFYSVNDVSGSGPISSPV